MRKLLSAMLIVCIIPLFGCGKSSPASGSLALPKPSELAESLKSGAKFEDQLDTIDLDTAATLYSIDKSTVADSTVYMGTGATAEEIAVFTANSKEEANKILEACKARIEDQKESFVSYVPAEMPKLESAVVSQSGSTVVLCISADNTKAKEIVEKSFK